MKRASLSLNHQRKMINSEQHVTYKNNKFKHMKTTNQFFKGIIIACLLITVSIFSQEQLYINVTTMHRNMNLEDFSMDEWKAVEVEYHEKVTMKNEYILSSTTLLHYFTSDNSEVVFITVYPSWTAIEEATKRNEELENEAWPDEATRKAFFKNQRTYYANEHSDEIYITIPGAKAIEETDLPLIYYVRTSYFAYPEDSDGAYNDEFMSMLNEYNEAVTHKNVYYKGYYPQVHFYGADRTEFVEVFVTETLAELERGISNQGKLFRAYWEGDDRQKEYNLVMDKFLTGIHGDRIFHSVPELNKTMEDPEE